MIKADSLEVKGNPNRIKPKPRRSTALNFEEDSDALKMLEKSQFNNKDAAEKSSDEDSL